MRKLIKILLLITVVWVYAPTIVEACPMCRVALEESAAKGDESSSPAENQPAAYMTSILFMLTMPFMIFGTIGGLLYYLNRHENKVAAELTSKALSSQLISQSASQ